MPFKIVRVDGDDESSSPPLLISTSNSSFPSGTDTPEHSISSRTHNTLIISSDNNDDDDDDDIDALRESVPFVPVRESSPSYQIPFPKNELRRSLLLLFAAFVFLFISLASKNRVFLVFLIPAALFAIPSVYILTLILLAYLQVDGYSYDLIPGALLF